MPAKLKIYILLTITSNYRQIWLPNEFCCIKHCGGVYEQNSVGVGD